jgi:DNA polymerase-4
MIIRTVMHLDMDAYFASVEQQCNPALRGKPIAVIGSGSRTVVTTASYEARKSGVKTGMTVFDVRRLCPEIIFVEGNSTKYTDTCAELARLYRQFTPLVEVFSVDEAFLDVTGSLALFGSARTIAQHIKKKIKRSFGLTCSAGIAPNKLLAKLASDLHKPDGLVEIAPAEVSAFLEGLPVSKLCGIGEKLAGKLSALGIHTCGELGRTAPLLLRYRFGIIGEVLHRMGKGEDESPVVALGSEPDAKSIGHSMTFSRDIIQQNILEAYLLQLAEMVGRRVRNSGFLGRTVSLTIRYADFTTFSRQRSLRDPVQGSLEIYRAAQQILRSVRLQQAVRLLGVSLSSLSRYAGQMPLFPEERRWQTITRTMDRINNKHGDFAITWGSLLNRYHHPDVISLTRRPEGVHKTAFPNR